MLDLSMFLLKPFIMQLHLRRGFSLYTLAYTAMTCARKLQKIRLPGPAEVDILTHDDSEAEEDDSDDHKLQGITIAVLHVSGFTLKFDNSVTSNIARKHRSLLKNVSSSLRISPKKLADFHHSLTHRHGGSTWFNQGKQ